MAALFGATLSLRVEDHPYTEEATQSLVAGFHLVSGWVHGQQEAGRVEGLREYARAIAAFPGAPGTEEILERVLRPVIDTTPVFRLALQCAPLLEHQHGHLPYRIDGHQAEPPADLRRRYERLAARRSPALLPMTLMSEEAVGCGHCFISLPMADAARALAGVEVAQCPQCGRLLVPFDFTDPGVRAVLEMVLAPSSPEAS